MQKSLETQEPEIIFRINQNYFYSETYRDMFLQINKRYNLNYRFNSFLKIVRQLTPIAQNEHFIEYDFAVLDSDCVKYQTETTLLLPKSALLR